MFGLASRKRRGLFAKNNMSESLDKSYLSAWASNLGPVET